MKKKILFIIIGLLFITGCGSKKDFSKYIGVWKNNDSEIPDEEVVIERVNDDVVGFNYYLYRLCDFNDIEATMDGTKGTFETKNELEWTIKGTIELDNDTVTLTITDSSSDLVSKTTTVFKIKDDESSIKEKNSVSNFDISDYTGVWRNDDSSNPTDELIIGAASGNEVTFDYLIDGITTFENVSARLNDNTAEFDVVNDLGWSLRGYFVMSDNKVTLTIEESSSEYIDKATTVYELHRDKSKLK